MAEDLEEIKGRLGQLERYVNLLESRVDAQESAMKLYTAGRKPAAQSSAQDTASAQQGENDLRLKGFDYLLRSILTKQGIHNGDLRSALRRQERLESSVERVIGKLNSIEETLRGVDRNGRGLVELLKARPESS